MPDSLLNILIQTNDKKFNAKNNNKNSYCWRSGHRAGFQGSEKKD